MTTFGRIKPSIRFLSECSGSLSRMLLFMFGSPDERVDVRCIAQENQNPPSHPETLGDNECREDEKGKEIIGASAHSLNPQV